MRNVDVVLVLVRALDLVLVFVRAFFAQGEDEIRVQRDVKLGVFQGGYYQQGQTGRNPHFPCTVR